MDIQIEFGGDMTLSDTKAVKPDLRKWVTYILARLYNFSLKQLSPVSGYHFALIQFFQSYVRQKVFRHITIIYGHGLKLVSYIYICSGRAAHFDHTVDGGRQVSILAKYTIYIVYLFLLLDGISKRCLVGKPFGEKGSRFVMAYYLQPERLLRTGTLQPKQSQYKKQPFHPYKVKDNAKDEFRFWHWQ